MCLVPAVHVDITASALNPPQNLIKNLSRLRHPAKIRGQHLSVSNNLINSLIYPVGPFGVSEVAQH